MQTIGVLSHKYVFICLKLIRKQVIKHDWCWISEPDSTEHHNYQAGSCTLICLFSLGSLTKRFLLYLMNLNNGSHLAYCVDKSD